MGHRKSQSKAAKSCEASFWAAKAKVKTWKENWFLLSKANKDQLESYLTS